MGAAAAAAAPLAAEIPQWRAVLLAAPREARPKNPLASIRISHRSRVVFNHTLPPDTAWFEPAKIRFSDLAAAGHVLVWADVAMEGRDTSTITMLYDFAPGSQRPRVTMHSWWIFGYKERKVDGETVFVTSDRAYYALFDVREFSVEPILVQAYRAGTFVDVTSAHPQLVAGEVATYRSGFQPGVCESDEAMGAYLADMVRLGETQRGIADVTGMLHGESDARFFDLMNTVLHAEKLIPHGQQLGVVAGVARCDPNKKRTRT
jgi:hypothetical protein